MNYRRLGRSGLMVSELVLGTMNFGDRTDYQHSAAILQAALEAGINLLDCADYYSDGQSETFLGRALAETGRRQEVILTSKAYYPTGPGPNDRGLSRRHLIASCETSLKKLKTDYLDVFFFHRTDWDIPQEEYLATADLLVRQGKIRYLGLSTFPAWRTVEAWHLADRRGWFKPVCEQPPYNFLDRRIENDLIPMCQAYDLGLIAWSPLAQGMLAGRYTDADNLPPDSRGRYRDIYAQRITGGGIEAAKRLAELARDKGCTLPQLAVAWLLAQPGLTGAIIGPRTMDHLTDLLGAVDIELTEADLAACDAIVPPGDFVSNHLNTSGWMKQGLGTASK